MPHEKITIPNPGHLNPDGSESEASKLWVPKGLMVQWGPYGEQDGSPSVGIGTGDFEDSEERIQRINSGGGKLEDMMMLWFNRSQVNQAIRLLRRARNAVYGVDE